MSLVMPNYTAQVARAFDRAAKHYQTQAYLLQQKSLQQQCHQILQSLFKGRFQNSRAQEKKHYLLDLGCGPASHTAFLSCYSQVYIGLDLSANMLQEASCHLNTGYKTPAQKNWVQGDAQALPFKPHSFDTLYSNLALQWCPAPTQIAAELFRVLKPQSNLFISTLVAGGMAPLFALKEKHLISAVNLYPTQAIWRQAFIEAGFKNVKIKEQSIDTYHKNARALLNSIKKIGASTLLEPTHSQERALGLKTKDWLNQVESCLEKFRQTEGILLPYQVAFIQADI